MTTATRTAAIIADHLAIPEPQVQPEACLRHDLGADDLDRIELAMALEDEFDVRLSDDEMASAETVQDVINLVEAELRTVTDD